MATIEVEVSLDDFDLNELLEEIDDRYNSVYGQSDKIIINEWLEDNFDINNTQSNFKIKNIIDQQKVDFLMENLDKININDLENLIKL